MTNKNRTYIIIFSLLFVMIIAGIIYVFKKDSFNTSSQSIDLLPASSIAFYQGTDFTNAYNQIANTPFFQAHSTKNTFKRIRYFIDIFDSISKKYPEVQELLKEHSGIWSIHKVSNTGFDLLFISRINENFTYTDAQSIVNDFMQKTPKERSFSGYTVYDVFGNNNTSILSFSIVEGNFVISKNPLLIEEAIRNFKNLKDKDKFLEKYKKQRLNEGAIFINYDNLNDLKSLLFKSEAFKKQLVNFGGLGAYELDYDENSFYLRGNILGYDTTASMLSLFNNQKADRINIPNVVSQKVSAFVCYKLSNYEKYYRNLQDQFYTIYSKDGYDKEFQEFEEKNNLQLQKEIVPLILGEFAYSVSEPVYEDIERSTSVYIKVIDTKKATQFFSGQSLNADPSDTFLPARNEDYKNYSIYSSNNTSVFKFLFGERFELYEHAYFTIIQDVLVFNPRIESLKQIIDDFENLQTLGKYKAYNRVRKNLSTDLNFLIYINPFRALTIPQTVFKENFIPGYQNGTDLFKKWNAFAFQVTNNSNSFYNEITANFDNTQQVTQESIWEVELDTTFSKKPFIVKNHNTNENEILVCDDLHKLYLISANGKILWKKTLNSEIVGDIYQIDLYNNDKLQYLFATQTHLYLLDRLGRNVSNYPIKLSAQATTGISMIEIKGKQRYFIGTDNNYIFGYDLAGKPLSGWSPVRTDGNLDFPLKYFIFRNQFRIFGATDNGNFYFWNEKGQQTTKPISLKTRFTNPFSMHFGGADSQTFLMSVDTAGKTYRIRLDLKVEIKTQGNWSDKLFFDYFDLVGGNDKEMVYLEKDLLVAYSINGDKRQTTYLDYPADEKPVFLKIDGTQYIAYLTKKAGHIYLTGMDGVNKDNFPVAATTAFELSDMNKDGNLELIAGKGKKLFLVRF
jgi:hypothetical protein